MNTVSNSFFLITDRFGQHVMQYTPAEINEVLTKTERAKLATDGFVTKGRSVWVDMIRAAQAVTVTA